MPQKINVDKLATEVYGRLMQYQKVTLDVMKNAVENTAKLTAQDINERAAEKFGGKKYCRSWSYKKDGSIKGKWAFSTVVYSKAPYYRLAHLLEHGHAKASGGRVKGREHISTPAQMAEKVLETYLIEGMKAK